MQYFTYSEVLVVAHYFNVYTAGIPLVWAKSKLSICPLDWSNCGKQKDAGLDFVCSFTSFCMSTLTAVITHKGHRLSFQAHNCTVKPIFYFPVSIGKCCIDKKVNLICRLLMLFGMASSPLHDTRPINVPLMSVLITLIEWMQNCYSLVKFANYKRAVVI